MGLFRKDNSAEKKLKELTGGFLLSNSFSNYIKSKGLEIEDGIKIKNQIKEEIKQGQVDEFNIESRINQLINEKSPITESSQNSKKCPNCGEIQNLDNIFCINCGYEFETSKPPKSQIECPNCNKLISKFTTLCPHCHKKVVLEKTCPVCNRKQDNDNNHCIECGYDFINSKPKSEMKKCPNCSYEFFENTMICPNCHFDFKSIEVSEKKDIKVKIISEDIDFARKTRFLHTFDYNLKTCHECNTEFLKTDPFCFNCGSSVLTQDTVKNDNLEIKDGKLVKKTANESDDELSSLEALYNHTVQSKYVPDFKMAYVLYLDHFKINPSKKFSDKTAKRYQTTVNKLKKQAIEDGFVELASPLAAARDFKVTDLKDIL